MPAYFTPELFRFLTRLKRNNNRDWFLAHKDEYERCARQPAIQFITDFAAPLYEITPHLVADPRGARGSLFRIYCFVSTAIPVFRPTSGLTKPISRCASP